MAPHLASASLNGDRPAHAPRGRPRDPTLEDRVFDAAIALYADSGWSGFSFEAVAKRSGVGKAGLYSRWPSRQVLLGQTLEARWLAPAKIDFGSLRGDLLALARQVFEVRTSAYAGAALWMALDREVHPEVREATAPYVEATIREGRAIVRRAVARGELPPDTRPSMLMDLIVGGTINRVSTTPPHLRVAMISKKEAFVEELVDTVLRGVRGPFA